MIFIDLTSLGHVSPQGVLAHLVDLVPRLLGLLGTEQFPGQLLPRLRDLDERLGSVEDIRLLVIGGLQTKKQ